MRPSLSTLISNRGMVKDQALFVDFLQQSYQLFLDDEREQLVDDMKGLVAQIHVEGYDSDLTETADVELRDALDRLRRIDTELMHLDELLPHVEEDQE